MRTIFLAMTVMSLLAAGCDDWRDTWPARVLEGILEGPRCPIVPTRLVLEVAGQRPRTVLTMDAEGGLEVALGPGVVARLDPRGCLYGEDGVWVEETREGQLWTLRGVTPVEDGVLRLGARGLRIRDDGVVADEPPSDVPVVAGVFRFVDLRPEGRCAARILLQAWLSMMPSMAVSDGHPVELPPPADSVCPDRHVPQPATTAH